MNNTKHTPAPWDYKGVYPQPLVITSKEKPVIAIIKELGSTNTNTNYANAKLIAAAPDLLEAVILALHDLQNEGGYINSDTAEMLKTAYFKATNYKI